METIKFSFIWYNKVFKKQVLELLKYVWSGSDEEIAKLFIWKYENNPIEQETIFLAVHHKKVVSIRGFIINNYIFREKGFKVATLADTVTHPDYRRKGLFKKLTAFSLQELSKNPEIKFTLNLSGSWPPYNGYIQLGWKPLGERESLYKIKVLNSFLRNKINITRPFDKRFANCLLVSNNPPSLHNLKNYEPSHSNRARLVWDLHYTIWRYSNPTKNYCFVYLFNKNNKLTCFLAFSIIRNKQYFLLESKYSDEKEFIYTINLFCKNMRAEIINAWKFSRSDKEIKILKNAGFFSLDFIFKLYRKTKPPALIRPIQHDFKDSDWIFNGEDLSHLFFWDLYRIDSDST